MFRAPFVVPARDNSLPASRNLFGLRKDGHEFSIELAQLHEPMVYKKRQPIARPGHRQMRSRRDRMLRVGPQIALLSLEIPCGDAVGFL